jgi:type II secretory pathway component PulC
MLALSFAPSLAVAEDAPPPPQQRQEVTPRLVPTFENDKFIGLKVYAIRKGSRLDQNGFQNGDVLMVIDGEPTNTDAGTRAAYDKVVRGDADASVKVRRRGQDITVESKRR